MPNSYQPAPYPVNTPPAWDQNRLGWLALAHFDGFGTRTLHKLAAWYKGDGAAAWHVPLQRLAELGVTVHHAAGFAEFRRRADLQGFAARLDKENIAFVLKPDAEYPALLKQIADPPYGLFKRGPPLPADQTCVAIVGTRNCTSYGKTVASQLARSLAQAGLVIVSGLALGIDALAHQAALEVGGRCVAVLGGGCDDAALYPRHNLRLAQDILRSNGTLLSEFPPGAEALKHHFPLRNRIISGLSRAVVVVEAAEDSGSLITAHQALEQNRDVFAVPGSVLNEQSAGTNKLLKLGAIPCTGAQDILDQLSVAQPAGTPSADPGSLPAPERALLELLDRPLQADDIARQLKLNAAEVSGLLVALELKGLIAPQGGQAYARCRLVLRQDD